MVTTTKETFDIWATLARSMLRTMVKQIIQIVRHSAFGKPSPAIWFSSSCIKLVWHLAKTCWIKTSGKQKTLITEILSRDLHILRHRCDPKTTPWKPSKGATTCRNRTAWDALRWHPSLFLCCCVQTWCFGTPKLMLARLPPPDKLFGSLSISPFRKRVSDWPTGNISNLKMLASGCSWFRNMTCGSFTWPIAAYTPNTLDVSNPNPSSRVQGFLSWQLFRHLPWCS